MKTIGVRLIGPAGSPSEIGSLIRGAAIGFSELGIETSLGVTDHQSAPRATLDAETAQKLDILIKTRHSTPFVAIHINNIEAITFVENEALANIAWVAPEYDRIPFIQSLLLQSVPLAEVWAPSKRQADMLRASMCINPKPVSMVPFGVNVPKAVQKLDGVTKEGHFYFSTACIPDLNSGIDILLDAFYSEFSKDEKVHLLWKPILNSIKPEEREKVASGLLNRFKKDSKASVICFTENQNDKFLDSMFLSSNCFVAPYRACGWGDMPMRAMACGIKVISNINTFNNSRMTHEVATMLTSKNMKIADVNWIMNNSIYQDCSWWEISKENLAKAMRVAYQDGISNTYASTTSSMIGKHQWTSVLMDAIANLKKYGEK